MTINPIGYFHSPLTTKFGIPRQSGLANNLEGYISFEPPYRHAEGLRGLEDFDFIWLIWEFSENHHEERNSQRLSLTVRPPLLGGNTRMGVFATRSPFRPNHLGLSSVRIRQIEWDTAEGPIIHVTGADLMDGTPIYDIKPYLPYADCHPEARGGFTDNHVWQKLQVVIPDQVQESLSSEDLHTLHELLELDPRPQYHDDPERVYGMTFRGQDYHFRVSQGVLTVISPASFNKK